MSEDKVIPEFRKCLIGKVSLAPTDDEFARRYPVLFELMVPRFDAKRRLTSEGGVCSQRVDGSLYRVTLICGSPDDVQTVMETTTLCDLWEQLELHVCKPDVAWTPTYDAKKRRRRGLDKYLDGNS